MNVHAYVSTACLHEFHPRCRMTCKFCTVPCRCHCHSSIHQQREVLTVPGGTVCVCSAESYCALHDPDITLSDAGPLVLTDQRFAPSGGNTDPGITPPAEQSTEAEFAESIHRYGGECMARSWWAQSNALRAENTALRAERDAARGEAFEHKEARAELERDDAIRAELRAVGEARRQRRALDAIRALCAEAEHGSHRRHAAVAVTDLREAMQDHLR